MHDEKNEKILLNKEFRLALGDWVYNFPAGLIDEGEEPIESARRELKEETGIIVQDTDEMQVINPCLFSTPGMTDESNALVKIVLNRERLSGISQDGAEGSECFDGFCFLTKKEAQKILKDGVDENGIFYSVYTWTALAFFAADMWK